MEIQPISYEDIDEITEICRRSLIHDKITPEVIAEKIFTEPRYRPDHALKAILDGRIISFMVGHVVKVDGQNTAWVKFFATAPDFRRHGVAKTLLGRLEESFRSEGATQVRSLDCAPNYLSAGVDVRYTEAVGLFERQGYQKVDENVDMLCSLDQDLSTSVEEERLKSTGLTIQRVTQENHAALFDLVDHHWPSWCYECEQALKNSPASIHIALDGSRVAAFSVYEGNNKGTGWFGPMGTDPDYRGRKIGEVLLKRCLADIRTLGHSEAIIPWVGPIYFYLKSVNAHIYRIFWVYAKEL